jgi:AhpD family alkylhydroperoxidase
MAAQINPERSPSGSTSAASRRLLGGDVDAQPGGDEGARWVDCDARLRELVRLRASQLNGCANCIDMHTKDARAVGETEKCPDGLERKRHACSFDNLERVLAA